MRTPFDTALRALRRDVDDLRTAIGEVNAGLTQVETRLAAARASIRTERALAARDWTLSLEAYLESARAGEEGLLAEQHTLDERLTTLREQAIERYGSLRAMEEAVAVYRAEAERMAATGEQAAVDDFAAARFIRAKRHARRAGTSRAVGR